MVIGDDSSAHIAEWGTRVDDGAWHQVIMTMMINDHSGDLYDDRGDGYYDDPGDDCGGSGSTFTICNPYCVILGWFDSWKRIARPYCWTF